MENYIIIAILVVAVLVGLHSARKHFKGEGGCCGGGGGEPKVKKKTLQDPVVAVKTIYIEGMHCENCKNRVQRQINQLDGAVAKVNLRKHVAVVSMSREISDEELKHVVEAADYKVTRIELRR